MDSNIIRNARNGDQDARDELGRWMDPVLRTYFKQRRVKAAEIDDHVQVTTTEVLAKLSIRAPEKPDAFKAWILGCARMRLRAASNERRRVHARAVKLHNQPVSSRTSLGGQLVKSEEWRILTDCMAQLPDRYRAAIERHIEHGSGDLGAGERWVLSRAKKKLRRLVENVVQRGMAISS